MSNHLGVYIKLERRNRDWSLGDLAQRAGVSKGYLSSLERGLVDPSLSHLELIAKAFGLGAGDLLVRAGYTVGGVPAVRTLTITIRGDVVKIENGH